jgi:hypothetical protein
MWATQGEACVQHLYEIVIRHRRILVKYKQYLAHLSDKPFETPVICSRNASFVKVRQDVDTCIPNTLMKSYIQYGRVIYGNNIFNEVLEAE